MCGIAGYSLGLDSRIERTVAARALLAGIAERGADAVGYAFRGPGAPVALHKQRSGATALLDRIQVPEDATQAILQSMSSERATLAAQFMRQLIEGKAEPEAVEAAHAQRA